MNFSTRGLNTEDWRLKEDLRENIRRCVSKIRPNQLEPMSTGHNSLPHHSTTLLLCGDQWERTSVDDRLKTEPSLLRRWVGTNGSLKERCINEYMSTLSAGAPVILLFLTRLYKEFEESGSPKTFEFFFKQTSTRASLIKITDLICNS